MYILLKDRAIITAESNTPIIEGMSVEDEIKKLFTKTPPINMENINKKRLNLPLREYCIKASYNSAYSGSEISEKMIRYVISRGCRFLDLQIFLSEKDNIPYVVNITDPTRKEMTSENMVLLDTILNTIAANAFATVQGNSGCPNPTDPLFIHLRIIPDKKMLVYDKVADYITKNFSTNSRAINNIGNATLIDQYTQIVGDDTIMKKTFFLIDKSYNPKYAVFSQKIANLMNGETGGEKFQVLDYSKMINRKTTPPIIKDDYRTTDVINETIVMPEILEKYPSPSIINMVVNYGVQITMYPFYKSSDELVQYELLFNEYKSAFIPMAYAIKYLDQLKSELESKNIQLGAL